MPIFDCQLGCVLSGVSWLNLNLIIYIFFTLLKRYDVAEASYMGFCSIYFALSLWAFILCMAL